VWPLSRSSTHECLRFGLLAAERWAGQGGALKRVASVALPAHAINEPECLGAALSELCVGKPQGKVSLVLESAWLPLVLVGVGDTLLAPTEAQALMRHRLGSNHGSQGDELSAWDIRVDYRAGERFALGYGLAPHVRQVLLSAAELAGLQLCGLVPAFTWGWQRLQSPLKTGWWVWPEQDRMLLARVEGGRLVAFNPAASLVDTGPAVEQLVHAEAARWGLLANAGTVTVASWHSPAQLPARSPGLTWRSLVGAP